MAKKRVKRMIYIMLRAFDMRKRMPDDKELKELMKEIERLEFDDISKGKENIRKDFLNLGEDFKKSSMLAKEKLEKEGCLI